MTEKLLTVQEVAGRLGLHHQTLRQAIKSGRLNALRIGRVLRIRPSDVELFIQSGLTGPRLGVPPSKAEARARFQKLRERLSRANGVTGATGVEILDGMRR